MVIQTMVTTKAVTTATWTVGFSTDDTIFPGTTFTPYSTRGGAQFKITIKYQLWESNWWFACQGRWVGYYPASLFMGNQSVFSTLGDHADHIGFWGEIFDSDDVAGRTASDMGSGYFPNSGWTWSGYMHNLLTQTDRGGGLSNYVAPSRFMRVIPTCTESRGTLTAARPGGATYTSGDQGPAKEGVALGVDEMLGNHR